MHFNYRLIARSGSPESWDQRSRWTWLTWIPAETCSYQSTSRVVWWECRVTAISGSSFKDPSKVCDLLITCVLSYETRFVLHWNIESPNRFSMQMSIPYRRITLILKDGWVDWKNDNFRVSCMDIARFQVDSWREKVTTSIYLTPFELKSTQMSYTFAIFNQSRNT